VESGEKTRPRILVITGPTASGKTSIAVKAALRSGAELVGSDSMQVYRHFDIGTAKPNQEDLQGVRHHLIDVADPDEPFDAARFLHLADRAIQNISKRGKQVIVVGGTGLYIRVLLHGLHKGPPPSAEVRKRLLQRARMEGWPALHGELELCDPQSAARLHPNDGARILRALEVFEASGIPMSEWQLRHGFAKWRYSAMILGIKRAREEINERIDARVDEMTDSGLLDEVKGLLARGYGRDLKPMQGLGYRSLAGHLAGEMGIEEAVEEIKTETRRFAKRQITWFNREPGLEWAEPDIDRIFERAERFWQGRPADDVCRDP
jgi:tRNA dimethylallyltransferase